MSDRAKEFLDHWESEHVRTVQHAQKRDEAGRLADSDDCGHLFRLKADSDSDRSRTAFR
jgi:hypothetical protein